MTPTWTVLVAESVTGRVVGSLPMASQAWELPLGFGGGRLEVTVPLDQPPAGSEVSVARRVRDVTVPGMRFMLIPVYGRTPITYGFVTTVAPDSTSARIGTTDLAGLLSRRRLIKPGWKWTPAAGGADTILGPTSKANLIRLLIIQALTETGASLPVDVDTVSTSGSEWRTYPSHQLGSYTDAIADLADDDDGPDIRVTPVLSADQRWVRLRVSIGEPTLGRPGQVTLHHPGNCSAVDLDYDFSVMANWHFVPGDGTDQGKPVGVANDQTLVTAGVPMLDRVDSSRGRSGDKALLDSYAAANAKVYTGGLEAMTLTVSAADTPMLGTYSPGDGVTVKTQGHWWLDDGAHQRRIVSISGDHTDSVKLTTVSA